MARPAEWLTNGVGLPPRVAWAFATDAELVDVCMSRETGTVFAADAVGGLYRLNSTGRAEAMNRNHRDIRRIAWDDRGEAGVIVHGRDGFSVLDGRLKSLWSADSPCEIRAAAIDPWGHNVVLSLDNGDSVLMNVDRKKLGQFHTIQPLKHLAFCAGQQRLIAAAEYGLMCCHEFNGTEVWNEKLWTTVGDMSITEDAKTIVIAGFAHGVQCFDKHGSSRSSYVVDGTPARVSCSYFGERIVVATVERHLYWLDSDGTLLWAAEAPDEVVRLICDPLGEWLILGLKSGRVMRLDWANACGNPDRNASSNGDGTDEIDFG